jgi:hypothetical protein
MYGRKALCRPGTSLLGKPMSNVGPNHDEVGRRDGQLIAVLNDQPRP